ncbi:hypothetical protein ZOD2009_16281 [Haladaptatus paucihalophilus DX253]|uniref:Uncharacterized protein n=1 Tax=Haladaptatus paucihalophilus DX253 TaxID=797209 RepID=E7QWR8_HALPU|nr:hypothetical protein ZOD2009_16281 [Haladaptatus paucihalophilus DX253]
MDGFAIVFFGSASSVLENRLNFLVECIVEVAGYILSFELVFHCCFDNQISHTSIQTV